LIWEIKLKSEIGGFKRDLFESNVNIKTNKIEKIGYVIWNLSPCLLGKLVL
jgi:hypothetical protein